MKRVLPIILMLVFTGLSAFANAQEPNYQMHDNFEDLNTLITNEEKPDDVRRLRGYDYFVMETENSDAGEGTVEAPAKGRRKKVGLVLSGGGAKGVAHVGVIKVLEEAGIPIDYIAGTSMGSIVGGLYSIGYTTRELDSLFRSQDWTTLLSDKIPRDDKLISEKELTDTYLISVPLSFDKKFVIPSGVIAGQSVLNLLNELTIGYHDESVDFNEFKIPFAAITYDLVKGEQVVERSGNLALAIRSSMSIPGVFAPVRRDSMMLVDGGIYNNFPIDIVREMGAEIVIGVDVSSGMRNAEELESIMGLFDQVTGILGRDMYDKNMQNIDLYMHPDIEPYTSASFSHEAIDTLLARGEKIARENWGNIVALRKKIGMDEVFAPYAPRVPIYESEYIRIGRITFKGLTETEEAGVRRNLGIRQNSTIKKAQLNDAISKLRGSGAFSYVTYTLQTRPPYNLNITVNEKQEVLVNIGFRFDSEELASILLNSTLSFRGMQGPKLGITGRLTSNPYIKAEFNSSKWGIGRLGASYTFRHNSYKLYEHGVSVNNVSFGQHTAELFIMDANFLNMSASFGIRYEYFNYNKPFLYAPDREILKVTPEGFLNYFGRLYYESINDRYYPTKGIVGDIDLTVYTSDGYHYKGGTAFSSLAYHFLWAFSFSDRFSVLANIDGRTLIGNTAAYSYLNYIGGEIAGRYRSQQIPFVGVNYIEHLDKSLLTFNLELRQQLWKHHYVSIKGAFGLQNDDFFRMFSEYKENVWGVGLKYSYRTPIGPISLQLHMSNLQKFGVYFNLGKTF